MLSRDERRQSGMAKIRIEVTIERQLAAAKRVVN